MSLGALETRTTVSLLPELKADELFLDEKPHSGDSLNRVSGFLNLVREMSGIQSYARVTSQNSFPQSAGVASSASAFAALALAASTAYDLGLNEKQLSILARRGSGSAARSIPGGFVEWHTGKTSEESYAETIAPPNSWPLWDCIAIVENAPKKIGSTQGHHLAGTSPLQLPRQKDTIRRLEICREAIYQKDFDKLADIIELDSNMMHSVMLTSNPRLMYWTSLSVNIMREVVDWRSAGVEAAFTLDAGPNVHIICTENSCLDVQRRLKEIQGLVDVLISPVGGCAVLIRD
jgi:diphosphomevalonate decarboxylase